LAKAESGSLARLEASIRSTIRAPILRLADAPRALDIEERADAKPRLAGLTGVKLVDREAITFLANFEKGNAMITNCPPYIREWIPRERAQS
jgi:hypothetical protein